MRDGARWVMGKRAFALSTVFLGLLALFHALLTWSWSATVALFGGGAILAFVGEVLVIHRGWLQHHIGPKWIGVPVYVLFGWTGVIYVALRIALVVTEGVVAAALAAGIATSYDLLFDHIGVARGYWTYTDGVPGPRLRAVPWWNYAGWALISFMTALGTVMVL